MVEELTDEDLGDCQRFCLFAFNWKQSWVIQIQGYFTPVAYLLRSKSVDELVDLLCFPPCMVLFYSGKMSSKPKSTVKKLCGNCRWFIAQKSHGFCGQRKKHLGMSHYSEWTSRIGSVSKNGIIASRHAERTQAALRAVDTSLRRQCTLLAALGLDFIPTTNRKHHSLLVAVPRAPYRGSVSAAVLVHARLRLLRLHLCPEFRASLTDASVEIWINAFFRVLSNLKSPRLKFLSGNFCVLFKVLLIYFGLLFSLPPWSNTWIVVLDFSIPNKQNICVS